MASSSQDKEDETYKEMMLAFEKQRKSPKRKAKSPPTVPKETLPLYLNSQQLSESYKHIPKTDLKIRFSQTTIALLWTLIAGHYLLIVISLIVSVNSMFTLSDSIAMNRSMYWWYFLYTILILTYCTLMAQTVYDRVNTGSQLMWCSTVTLIMLSIEVSIITRFLFVTFPIIEINWKYEPILMLTLSGLRLIIFIITTIILIGYMMGEPIQNTKKLPANIEWQ